MRNYLYFVSLLLSLLLSGCGDSKPANAPMAEGDINSVTFDEVGTEIADIINDDEFSVSGSLSIENIDGNNVLKFTDMSTNAENLKTAVQKIRFNVGMLLAPEQLAEVNSITFDLYAEAKDNLFVNDAGNNMEVAGWIGGGGGTVTADGSWYGFTDFSASGLQEYDLKRSDACHVTFRFLLASSGKCWNETVEDVNFLVMRWGMQNISDIYIDNLTFYDADGNSIPLTLSPAPNELPEITEDAT